MLLTKSFTHLILIILFQSINHKLQPIMHSSLGFLMNVLAIITLTSSGTKNSVSASDRSISSHVTRGIRTRDMRTMRARFLENFQVNSQVSSGSSLSKRQGKIAAGGAGGANRGDAVIKIASDRISIGLAATIAKYSALKEANLPLPTAAELSEAMSKSTEDVDSSQFVQVMRALKTGIDGLADRKLIEGGKSGGNRTNSSKERRQVRGGSRGMSASTSATPSTSTGALSSGASSSTPMSKDMIDGIASAFLEMITKFCDAKAAGGRLPTGTEISLTLQEVVKNGDIRNKVEIALSAKTSLEALADKLRSDTSGKSTKSTREKDN